MTNAKHDHEYSTNINPLVAEDSSDSLNIISTVLIFMQDYLWREKADAKIELRQTQLEGLYHINQCVIEAVNYEAEKASNKESHGVES